MEGPPNFFAILCPPIYHFLLKFYQHTFENFLNLEFHVWQCFWKNFLKFPENFLKFTQFYNHINQNWPIFPLKLQKIADFSLNPLNFSKFSAPSSPKILSFMSEKSRFFWEGFPTKSRVPPKLISVLILTNTNTKAKNFLFYRFWYADKPPFKWHYGYVNHFR